LKRQEISELIKDKTFGLPNPENLRNATIIFTYEAELK
jgi:hypothetical protein